jgi:uncharacterized protein (TIGR03086 family)
MSENAMTNWDVLNEAHQALRTVVRGASEDGWSKPTPCDEWTATQVLQHAAGDQLAYFSAITGQPGPSENPFTPSGHLEGAPSAIVEEALAAAASAWATIAPDAENVPTPLPQGALPPSTGAGACALDAAVHAWDIAVATGQASPLTPSLAALLIAVAKEIVEPLRAYGAYKPALDPREDDDEAAALLRYLGRDPGWAA